MRIAIVNWSCRQAGGAEKYLSGIIPELHRNGHALAFLHELDTPADRDRIALPDATPAWCVSEMGGESARAALHGWAPDIIFMQSSLRQEWISDTVARVPTIFFCHDYVGTCISGLKTFQLPVIRPCHRPFGWPCLLHYYPHHCGGWNPVTMWSEYRTQSRRLDLLRACRAIVTASEAMRQEYLKHGFDPERVHHVPLYASGGGRRKQVPHPLDPGQPARLLFAGRMERLKGGEIFLDALPRVREALGRPLHVTFAGDGTARAEWENKASALSMPIEFTGWIAPEALQARLAQSHLLVAPSVWPEPFGLIGLEAGLESVPAAAFAVGGIPGWLHHGVNGYLAPGDTPTASGLADAIVQCLRDPDTYARLCRGAYDMASQFSMSTHLEMLTKVFEKVAHA